MSYTTHRRCSHCGIEATIGEVVPYGIGPHTWLHPGCWAEWFKEKWLEERE